MSMHICALQCTRGRCHHLFCVRPYNLYCVGGDVKPCSINSVYAIRVLQSHGISASAHHLTFIYTDYFVSVFQQRQLLCAFCQTSPKRAMLGKRRRKEGNFPGSSVILKQLTEKPKRKRVGFISSGPSARGKVDFSNFSRSIFVQAYEI